MAVLVLATLAGAKAAAEAMREAAMVVFMIKVLECVCEKTDL